MIAASTSTSRRRRSEGAGAAGAVARDDIAEAAPGADWYALASLGSGTRPHRIAV